MSIHDRIDNPSDAARLCQVTGHAYAMAIPGSREEAEARLEHQRARQAYMQTAEYARALALVDKQRQSK